MRKPWLIVIAGPNGAGKTSVTGKILQHEWYEGCTYINPDIIARDEFGDWNSPDAVLKAVKKAAEMREQCLARKQSLLFETVFSAPDKLDYIHRARDAGYFLRLFFVSTEDPSINASRIAQRVKQGGHDVPISKIISRFGKSISNCSIAVKTVDRAYIYDNSIEYADPQLLFRSVDGRLEKVYAKVNDWAKEILRSLEEDR
jgi:predicted ABC-type ATPase